MEEIKSEFAALQEELKEYLELKLELFQLRMIDTGTGAGARLMAALLLALAALGALLFIGIGLSFLAGDYLNSTPAGFFVVGGICLILILISVAFRKTLVIKPLRFILLKWIIRRKEN